MLEFLFNKVTDLQKRAQHKCFSMNIVKFLREDFLDNTSGGCFCRLSAALFNSFQATILFDGLCFSDVFSGCSGMGMKWTVVDSVSMLCSLPSSHLLVQSQQQKHQSNVWNLFKVNSKENNDVIEVLSVIFIVNFEQISYIVLVFLLLLWTSECRLSNNLISIFPLNPILKSVELSRSIGTKLIKCHIKFFYY